MKKLLLIIPILMFAVFGCKNNADNTSAKVDLAQLEKRLTSIESADDKEAKVTVKVEKLVDVKEMPGYVYVKVTTDKDS